MSDEITCLMDLMSNAKKTLEHEKQIKDKNTLEGKWGNYLLIQAVKKLIRQKELLVSLCVYNYQMKHCRLNHAYILLLALLKVNMKSNIEFSENEINFKDLSLSLDSLYYGWFLTDYSKDVLKQISDNIFNLPNLCTLTIEVNEQMPVRHYNNNEKMTKLLQSLFHGASKYGNLNKFSFNVDFSNGKLSYKKDYNKFIVDLTCLLEQLHPLNILPLFVKFRGANKIFQDKILAKFINSLITKINLQKLSWDLEGYIGKIMEILAAISNPYARIMHGKS